MNSKKTKAFTLLELMIVIAIIGILAAIIIPTFTDGGEGSVIGGPGTSINCPQ